MTVFSAALLLFLVMDPFGNVPVFLTVLRPVAPERRRRVIARELLIALAFLVLFLFAGRYLLDAIGISEATLTVAGGVILFLISIRMVFPPPGGAFAADTEEGGDEPFLVPLAVPFIAGPSVLASVLFIMSSDPTRWLAWLGAVLLAWAITGAVLLLSTNLAELLGRRGLVAIERLMGMVLTAIATKMILTGIGEFFPSNQQHTQQREEPMDEKTSSPAMRVRFWGVRGSIPTPGPSTVRYGGNTSCVSIEFADNHVLVLDAGTGIRLLGDELASGDADISVALTHTHWDHIQGFPYFAPLFQPGRTIYFAPHARARLLFEDLIQQMDGARFPIARDQLPSALTFMPEPAFMARLREIAEVSRLCVNHPGNTDGIRVRCNGRTVVFIPDNELDPPYEPIARFDEIVAFCRHADVLIHDAQYLEEDMPEKSGWGHSVVGRVCDLAAEAEAKHLVLFHHDPGRTDDQLDSIEKAAQARLERLGSAARCTVAYEGLVLTV